MSATYLFDLEKEDNGTWLATSTAFPEVNTFVDEIGDLMVVGVGALEEAIAARIAQGQDIPMSANQAEIATCHLSEEASTARTWVKLPHQTTLKVLLYALLRSEGMTRAELARRLDWNRESVDRLFRLDHNTRTTQFDAAFRELGRDLEVKLTPLRDTISSLASAASR